MHFLCLKHFLDLMYTVLEGVLVRTSNRSATTFNLRLKVVPKQCIGISHNNAHLPGRLQAGTRQTDRNVLPSSSPIVVGLFST